jgi:hypothetical protein
MSSSSPSSADEVLDNGIFGEKHGLIVLSKKE